jgi:hypothetical protein
LKVEDALRTDADLIRKINFLAPLDHKIINEIANMCIVREFQPGDTVVKQGEPGLGLYFITAGRVKVEVERNATRTEIAELTAGDFLGELSVIDATGRSAVICIEETRCLLLTRDAFSKLINKHPEISLHMAKSLVGRNRAANGRAVAARNGPRQAEAVPAAYTATGEPAPRNGSSPQSPLLSMIEQFSPANFVPDLKMRQTDAVKVYSSTKARTKDFLVDLFSPLYMMRAMTKFSMAMVGCPVTVQADAPEVVDCQIQQIVIDGVKLIVFPASDDQVLRISAYDDGDYSVTVLRPGADEPEAIARFRGKVMRNDVLRLHVPRRGSRSRVHLTRGEQVRRVGRQ